MNDDLENEPAPFENRVGGMEKMTMLDYPNHLACILFYVGCNLRCPYCYNPSLIIQDKPQFLTVKEIVEYLFLRRGVLDAVVFSGGECTLWGDKLVYDIKFVRNIGYKVKIDTNGQKPDFIKQLLDDGLLDYVALDIKANSAKEKQFHCNTELTYKTLSILQDSGVKYETRTTIHPDVTTEKDISDMLGELSHHVEEHHTHYLQYFFPAPQTLGDVNPKPRYFKLSSVDFHGITLVERGAERNGKLK